MEGGSVDSDARGQRASHLSRPGRGEPSRSAAESKSSEIDLLDSFVARAKAGDRTAIGELYTRHVDLVYGYLRANNCQDVEDATADVFASVVRRIATFEGGASAFKAWLMTIAHNRLVDSRRKRSRRVTEVLGLRESSDDVDSDESQRQQIGRERTPLLLDDQIVAAMQSLTEQQREVLGLRFLADLSLDEVARITGRSLTATKAVQRRALAAVRRFLAGQGAAVGDDASAPGGVPPQVPLKAQQITIGEVRHVQ